MHVTLSECGTVKRGPLLLRFVDFIDAAMVVAETPETGSVRTTLERWCDEAHWAVVLRGDAELERDGVRVPLPPGSAFHVPSGPPSHRLVTSGRLIMAGMVPLAGRTGENGSLVAEDFGVVSPGVVRHEDEAAEPVVAKPNGTSVSLEEGRVLAEMAEMGEWIFTRVTFGPTSGYATSWCDAAHYGLVLRGTMAIEWENDVEVVGAGDVYHCPGGPPGHRLEVADSAVAVDFTPRAAFQAGKRVAGWRPTLLAASAAS